jgi:hypothetical protein
MSFSKRSAETAEIISYSLGSVCGGTVCAKEKLEAINNPATKYNTDLFISMGLSQGEIIQSAWPLHKKKYERLKSVRIIKKMEARYHFNS